MTSDDHQFSQDGAVTQTICSMTGFARSSGGHNGLAWAWEARSVNGRSLDVRLRLPNTFERLEQQVRLLAGARFKRGSVQISLQVQDQQRESAVIINERLLETLKALARRHSEAGSRGVEIAQLLNVRGVVELIEAPLEQSSLASLDEALLAGLEQTLAGLLEARRSEGAALAQIVAGQLQRMETLVMAIRDNPARRPETIQQKFAQQMERLLDASKVTLDAVRLHQEAALLVSKADVQEEIDRLLSHIASARSLLAASDAAGRKLDFLVQELNREANTLCSKSTDLSVTAAGIELKLVIDQLREQALNIE